MSTITSILTRRCERCDWEFVTDDPRKQFCSTRCEEGGGMTPLVWTPHRVVECASEAFGVDSSTLLGRERSHPLVFYRMVAYAAVRRFCGLSSVQTAKVFHRDHKSILSAVQRVESDPHLSELYSRLAERLLVEGLA